MTAIDEPRTPSGFRPTHDRRAEVGRTLDDPVPQTLGLIDQFGLWSNLGVSLLGFTGALYVLQPGGGGTPDLSLLAGLVAIVVGTLLGTLAVAAAAVPGARTGAPAMVLLRGLFGARLSWAPTVLNVVQCLGWGVFEIVTIASAAHRVGGGLPKNAYVVIAGLITIGLTVRPLGAVRVLRRYVGVALVVVLAYLFIQVLRHPLPPLELGTWHGFWSATDTTVAVAVSFVPLASDYTRHARSERTAFAGTLLGYGVAQVLCYVLGLLCLLTVARRSGDIYGAFIAVPLGQAAFGVLAIRELDQSFANVYSTAASVQNLRRGLDRRVLAVVIGATCTVGALFLSVGDDYQSFLLILGSVFVPMFAVLVVDFFVCSRGRWNLAPDARSRWMMLGPWAVGFVAYQMINPGTLSWWSSLWGSVNDAVGFHPASWMSASVCSFVVAAVLTVGAVAVERAMGGRSRRSAAPG